MTLNEGIDRWAGDTRFCRRVTSDGFDLRVGLLRDGVTFGWLAYEASTMDRLGWGDGAPTMEAARARAEQCIEGARAAMRPRARSRRQTIGGAR